MGQPVLLVGQVDVLTGLRVDRLDLLEPEPEQVSLLRPLPGTCGQLGQLVLQGPQLGVGSGVAAQGLTDGVAGVAVECVALAARRKKPRLVGLPVHGDAELGKLGQHADGHGPPADVGS